MLTTLAFVLFSAVPNATPAWERILLPVVTRGPVAGAQGSLWETVVTLRNANDQTVIYYPTDCPLVPPVPERFCVQTLNPQLGAGVTKRVDLLYGGPLFLNVTRELADRVFVQVRVHDLSRQAESFGTEVPVIRSAQMKTDAGQILDIPRDPRFRLTFRLYADYPAVDSEIAVRFVSEATAQSHALRYTIPAPPEWILATEPLVFPALYRQISDFDADRIEIDPLTPGLRYWAFVSVTNNETQQITTLSVR